MVECTDLEKIEVCSHRGAAHTEVKIRLLFMCDICRLFLHASRSLCDRTAFLHKLVDTLNEVHCPSSKGRLIVHLCQAIWPKMIAKPKCSQQLV